MSGQGLTVFGQHVFPEDNTVPVTIAISDKVDGAQGGVTSQAFVQNAALAFSMPAPQPQKPRAPVVASTDVELRFLNFATGNNINYINTKKPVILPINDNFDMLQINPTTKKFVPDDMPNPETGAFQLTQLAEADPQLLDGTVTFKNPGVVGGLTWNVGASLVLFANFGTGWDRIKDGQTFNDFKTPNNPIALVAEGIRTTGAADDTISVTFTPNNGKAFPKRTAYLQVYSGLKLPASDQQPTLISQLSRVTGLSLSDDGSGNIFVTSGPSVADWEDPFKAWMGDVRNQFFMVQVNTDAKKRSGITTINTGGDPQILFDSFKAAQIDTGDMDFVITKSLRLGAVFLVHAIKEQYYHQIKNLPGETAHTNAIEDEKPIIDATKRNVNAQFEFSAAPGQEFKYIHLIWILSNGNVVDFYAEAVPDNPTVQVVSPAMVNFVNVNGVDPNLTEPLTVQDVESIIVGPVPPSDRLQ